MPLSQHLETAIRNREINQITPEELGEDREDWNYAFQLAAEYGNFSAIELLLAQTPNQEEQQAMIGADDYEAFRLAAMNGHGEIVLFLLRQLPEEERQEMVHFENNEAVRSAATNRHAEVVILLLGQVPGEEQQQAMISTLNRTSFGNDPKIKTFLNIIYGDDLSAPGSESNKTNGQKVTKLQQLRKLLIKGFEELDTQVVPPNDAANLVIGELLTGDNLSRQAKSVEASVQLSRGQNKTGLPEDVIGHVGGFLQPRISGLLSPEQKEVAQKVMEGFFSKGFAIPEKPTSKRPRENDDGETKTPEKEELGGEPKKRIKLESQQEPDFKVIPTNSKQVQELTSKSQNK